MQMINAATPLGDARAVLAETFDLGFSAAVERETAPLFDTLRSRIPPVEWPFLAPLILQINRLKREKHAAILAHNYQAPPIFYGVADITGDTIGLALAAAKLDAAVLLQAGVHFMAETTKLLNPERLVLIPDSRAGCSLVSSIMVEDVQALKAAYPGAPVVAYLSSSAAIKAMADICCTAANAVTIVAGLDSDTVILLPDQYLAKNIARQTGKKIIAWGGSCEVHRSFSAHDIAELRAAYPDARIITHPEAPPEVVQAADYAGPSIGMIDWLAAEKPKRVVMVTECSLADNLAAASPGTEFVRGCNICPHMKRITLENILWALHTGAEEITIAPEIEPPAANALRRMLAAESRPA